MGGTLKKEQRKKEQLLSFFERYVSELDVVVKKDQEVGKALVDLKELKWNMDPDFTKLQDLKSDIENLSSKISEIKSQQKVLSVHWAKKKKMREVELEEYKLKMKSNLKESTEAELIINSLNEEYAKVQEKIGELEDVRVEFENSVAVEYSTVLEITQQFTENVRSDLASLQESLTQLNIQ